MMDKQELEHLRFHVETVYAKNDAFQKNLIALIDREIHRIESRRKVPLAPCKCGCKAWMYTERKVGVPSGDLGYQVVIGGLCGASRQVTWALRKSWAEKTAAEKWNEKMEGNDG